MEQPSIGQTVLYQLNKHDAEWIDANIPGDRRNPVREGDIYPATIVRTFDGSVVNLRVMLDGTADYWATSRSPMPVGGYWGRCAVSTPVTNENGYRERDAVTLVAER